MRRGADLREQRTITRGGRGAPPSARKPSRSRVEPEEQEPEEEQEQEQEQEPEQEADEESKKQERRDSMDGFSFRPGKAEGGS